MLCLAGSLLWIVPARADDDPGLSYFQHGQFAEAFQEWRTAAEAGNARAALSIGALYDTGLGVPQDYGQARDWYRRAADAGSPTGMFNLGVMNDAGRPGPPDPAAAAEWYRRAAASGAARASYNLALLYEAGVGVPRDLDQALRLYRDAATNGIDAARDHLRQLGHPYYGAAKRVEDPGMRDFQRAEQILLARGPAEAAQAVVLFRRAAAEGNALAEYDLAYCYEHGIGVVADPAQATSFYRHPAASATDPHIRALAEHAAFGMQSEGDLAKR